MYSELPPTEKEAWVTRAEADKARYLHELASYMPPAGYDSKGDAIVNPILAKGARKGKPEKDINAPKRNMSAYLLYQNAMREQFKRENPGMVSSGTSIASDKFSLRHLVFSSDFLFFQTFGQLAKYTSHMYKNLTPDEKETWENRAQQDKVRYDAEIANYVPPPGHDSRGVLIEDNRPRKRSKRGPKDPAAPKRASGAYVFFTNEMRPKVLAEYPGIKFVDLGKVLGERWRALTADEKKRYENMAAEDKIRFQMEMQQYTANRQGPPAPAQAQVPSDHVYYDHATTSMHDAYAYDQVAHDPYGQHQVHYTG